MGLFKVGLLVEWRTIRGGAVAQVRDAGDPPTASGAWPAAARPSGPRAALRFAWIVCAHVKSNAIVLAGDGHGRHRRRAAQPGRRRASGRDQGRRTGAGR